MVNVSNKLKFLSLAMCLLAANNAYTMRYTSEGREACKAAFNEKNAQYSACSTDREQALCLGFTDANEAFPAQRIAANTHKMFKDFAEGKTLPAVQFPLCDEDLLSFKGIGVDMAKKHLLIIPRKKPICNIFELAPKDVPLLIAMKNAGINWFERAAFDGALTVDLGIPRKHVLTEEQKQAIKFGFHKDPTINYLHLHALAGDITEEGMKLEEKWIPHDVVVEYLEGGAAQ